MLSLHEPNPAPILALDHPRAYYLRWAVLASDLGLGVRVDQSANAYATGVMKCDPAIATDRLKSTIPTAGWPRTGSFRNV